ncbi:MAG: hypothetical protein K2X91_06380, partial [Thermoleophilia bacterium]|nr:hypothetical protein [Thermoleophilia bacterium]
FHQRATLRRAAAEITRAENRYQRVAVELGERRGAHVLIATRRLTREFAAGVEQGSSRDGRGQAVR